MTVAADITNLSKAKDPAYKDFIPGLLQELAHRNPLHRFIFFARRDDALPAFPANVRVLPAGRAAGSSLLRSYWMTIQVPALLKKLGADLFLTTDGSLSGATPIPQYLLLEEPGTGRKQGRLGSAYFRKAAKLILFSTTHQQELIKSFSIPPARTACLSAAAPDPGGALTPEEMQTIKQQYTGGKEYFICTAPLRKSGNLLNLLKAFSLFKKRQQSGMQLLLTGSADPKDRWFTDSLERYKYRADVVLAGHLPANEKIRLIKAAYAFIDPHPRAGLGIAAQQAAACAVPVIAAGPQPLLPPETFLEADPASPDELATQLMRLYKDENGRNRLVEKGSTAAAAHSLAQTAEALWQLFPASLTGTL